MRRIIIFLILFSALCSINMFDKSCSYALEDAIIAIVNDDAITFSDLKNYLNTLYLQLKLSGMKAEEINAIMEDMKVTGLDKLIEDKLILDKANGMKLEVREELVDQRIAETKKKYKTEQKFLDTLKSEGASITDLKNDIRDQLKIKYIIDYEVRSKMVVNPQEVTDYYNNNLEQFRKPERMDLASIFISNENGVAEAREKADKVLEMLKQKDADFFRIALEYSEGPSIGIVQKGQLLPHIENVVFSLSKGEISPVTETDNGFYIFKVKDKLPQELPSLEEVKENISNMLYQIKFRKNFQEWVEKLKKDAFIEIKGTTQEQKQ